MSERMIERDAESESWLKDNRITQIRDQLPEEGLLGPEFCQECGNDIPMKRREHGFELCVGCARVNEVINGR